MRKLSIKEMKNRQYLFIVGCLLALIVCYKFAISNTLLLYSEYKIIANSNPTIEKQESTHILSELNKLNILFEEYIADTLTVHENLLDEVNTICNVNHCKMVSFPETKLYNEFSFWVMSNSMEFEGNYFNLLKVLHAIEYSRGKGKINSCSFYVKEDLFKKTKKLRMKVIIQNISNQKF